MVGDYGEADKTRERRLDIKNQRITRPDANPLAAYVINLTQISRNLGRNISVYLVTLS